VNRARAEAAAAAALALGAVVLWAVTRTYPNYDSYYHLVWGRELLDGLRPSFEAYAAPTQHPLYVALAALLGLLGEPGDRALVLVCLLSHAALVFGAYRLGRAVFGLWPGLMAAAFVGASASFLLYAARGYVDAPFLALVVWAGVLEVEARDHGRPMALLAPAGLLRPEAWVLAVAYWLWKGPRRLGLAAAALAAPIAWALVDLAVTGDPLHSFNATSELADDLGRERGLDEVPASFVSFLGSTVRPPVAVLAVAGLVVALVRVGWRRTLVPLALFGAGVATFVGTGVLGLSILPRYLTVPAVALCVFAGYGLAGFTTLAASDPWRRPWMRASAAAAVVGVAVLVALAPSLDRVSAEVEFIRESHDALVALLDDPKVRAARRCGPLTFPTYRLVPDARWHLDAPRSAVSARSARRRRFGAAVFVLTPKGLRRFGFAAGAPTSANLPDPGYRPLTRNERFSAYVRCPGDRSLSRATPSAPTAARSGSARSG
jgi:hypothetical protein